METLWHELGDLKVLPGDIPSDEMTRRFQRALTEYEAGLQERSRPSFADWWTGLWSIRPAWQAAFSVALLLLGVLLGTGLAGTRSTTGELEALRAELESMGRAVTVSLLQHQSAAERLRAVSWSRVAGGDAQVLSALLDSARSDPNVNVRVAAVDALAAYVDQGVVRSRLIDTLEREKSPLVQLAVLEAIARDEGLRHGELQRLREAGEVDETLLQYFNDEAESL